MLGTIAKAPPIKALSHGHNYSTRASTYTKRHPSHAFSACLWQQPIQPSRPTAFF
jgi:hypothetical protein